MMFARILTRRFAANYLSTLAFIGLSYWIISDLSDWHRNMINAQFLLPAMGGALHIHTLMHVLIGVYIVALIPFYARHPWLHSKAFVFLQGLRLTVQRLFRPASRARLARNARDRMRLPLRFGFSPTTTQAALALLLKFFFAPLMINWCLAHAGDMTGSIAQVIDGWNQGQRGRILFDSSLFWACFQAILFIDTFLFTIGYIVEIPALRNRIRSVDPTFLGWFVCIACYPPFNGVTAMYLEWQSNDFPQFQGDTLHFVANVTLLLLMAIYSWASVALGFKASNLTNRGIVARGPYSVIRHPAYAAKNLAWWIGAFPTLYVLWSTNNLKGLAYALFSLTCWSLIYGFRAITEERHLLMADNGYAEYMARVRHRFIPKVI